MDSLSLVELRWFYSQVDAELARLRLEAEGITSVIFDTSAHFAGAITGVRLMVLEEEKEAAERVLGEGEGS
jgi:hypothetical protein